MATCSRVIGVEGAKQWDPGADEHRHARYHDAIDKSRPEKLLDRESTVDVEMLDERAASCERTTVGGPEMGSTTAPLGAGGIGRLLRTNTGVVP